MTTPVVQTRVVSCFTCLGDACADTCCKGWNMQLSADDVKRYETEAPELLNAVTQEEAGYIMKRDPKTECCVKFKEGWCGIHARYGARMLGDACYFFPRVTRSLGGKTLVTASMGCPEIARLTLTMGAPCAPVAAEAERMPYSLKDYGVENLPSEAMWRVHEAFLAHVRSGGLPAERALMHIVSVARSLVLLPPDQWDVAVGFYLRMADGRLPVPEPKAADPFHILNALQGLVGAANVAPRQRLSGIIECLSDVMGAALDWQALRVDITEESPQRYLRMHAFWRDRMAEHYAPLLSRWLEGQLSLSLFPFAGLGRNMVERSTIIAVRFATLKLALMAESFRVQAALVEEECVRVVQGLSRFLDHLADPQLSLQIYEELGWTREARLRALVGDGD